MNLLNQMANDIILDKDYILNIANNNTKFYRKYLIQKKSGGWRNIYHPSPELKALQYYIVFKILREYPISKYCYSYRKGLSIKLNAEVHANCKHLLHLDIQNFFESIRQEHLQSVFNDRLDITQNKLNLFDTDRKLICDICFYGNTLTIGSISSPIISNLIMINIDNALGELANDKYLYTRYADDMFFSSDSFIDSILVENVESVINDNGFQLNRNKTYFTSSKNRKSVTGLVVDRGRITIGVRKKRELKKMIYNKLKHGIGNANEILGHLSFLKDIEPGYFNKLIIKYSRFGNVLQILKQDAKTTYELASPEAAPTKEH